MMQSPNGNRFSTPNVPNSPTESTNQNSKMSCDDCAIRPPVVLRWCEKCKSAICDSCVLDRHHGHQINNYQKATRDSKMEFGKFLTRMRNETPELQAMKQSNERFEKEILVKIDSDALKVQKRAKEVEDMCKKLKRAHDDLEALTREPLTGKSVCERRHAALSAKTLIESLTKRQAMIEKQMQTALTVVEEAYAGP